MFRGGCSATCHTPRNSISTSFENAFLNAFDCFHPSSSALVYILYANGTCWWLHVGRRPTLWIIPARLSGDQLNGFANSILGRLTTGQCRHRAKTQRCKSDHGPGLGEWSSISWFIDDSWLRLQFCIKNSYPPVGSYQIPELQMGCSGLTHNVGIEVARNGHVKVLVEI